MLQVIKLKYKFSEITYHVLGYWNWFAWINDSTPLIYRRNIFLVDLFRACVTILVWTKCRLVTKHVLSITHFHSWFFLSFPFKFHLYKKFRLSKHYLLLIYTFMCMIIFLRIIVLSFQSHQTRILSAGFGMAWNR